MHPDPAPRSPLGAGAALPETPSPPAPAETGEGPSADAAAVLRGAAREVAARGIAMATRRDIAPHLPGNVAEGQSFIRDSADLVRRLTGEDHDVARRLRFASYLDEDRLRFSSVYRISVRCSDGRCNDTDHHADALLHHCFGEERIAQAGCLVIPGTGAITSVEGSSGIDAFYEHHRSEIAAVLEAYFAEPIEQEVAWQRRALARLAGKRDVASSAMAALVRSKRIQLPLISHSQGASYLDLLEERGFTGVASDPVPVASLYPNSDVPPDFHHCATHGCGAHKSSMPAALLETVKQGLLIDRWLQERFPELTGRIEIVREHLFTGATLQSVLTEDLDDRILDADGSHLTTLPEDFRRAAQRFRLPSSARHHWVEERRIEGVRNELLPHDLAEHSEQVVAVTNNPIVFALPGVDVLDLHWSPDADHLELLTETLIGIALKNYGARHPDRKIFLVLDRPYRPDYRKVAIWGDDPSYEERTTGKQRTPLTPAERVKARAFRVTWEAGEITAREVVEQGPRVVDFVRDPSALSHDEVLRNQWENDVARRVADTLASRIDAWLAMHPEIAARVEVVRVSTNRRSFKVHTEADLAYRGYARSATTPPPPIDV